MDKNCFDKLLDAPNGFSPDEWTQLRRERDNYPFSAPLQVLSLMADKASGAPLWEQQSLPRVALFFQDKEWLDQQLAASSWTPKLQNIQTQDPSPTQEAPMIEVEQPFIEPIIENDGPFDILKEINSYQEVSFKTAPKSVILTNFLEKDGGIHLEISSEEDASVQDLAKKSIEPQETLESETLAIILEKQGKIDQALAMYEKLLANNPKKSSIFAVRIAALRERLDENN